MNASELSEQIKAHLDAGEWAQAQQALCEAWLAQSEFGIMRCSRPEYPEVWVRFKTSGYPFGLRRRWAEFNDEETLATVLSYVVEWNLPELSGAVAPLGPAGQGPALPLLDNVDDALVMWLVSAFVRFWRVELPQPRKN